MWLRSPCRGGCGSRGCWVDAHVFRGVAPTASSAGVCQVAVFLDLLVIGRFAGRARSETPLAPHNRIIFHTCAECESGRKPLVCVVQQLVWSGRERGVRVLLHLEREVFLRFFERGHQRARG